jgi:hypothetical protein
MLFSQEAKLVYANGSIDFDLFFSLTRAKQVEFLAQLEVDGKKEPLIKLKAEALRRDAQPDTYLKDLDKHKKLLELRAAEDAEKKAAEQRQLELEAIEARKREEEEMQKSKPRYSPDLFKRKLLPD